MARVSGIQLAALLLALVVCTHALKLPAKKVPLTRDQLDQIKEQKEADQFQAQIDQLNDKVFPASDAAAKSGEWTHQSADAMQKHWENIASRDSGVALDEPAKQAVKAKAEHHKMMHAKHAAHKAMMHHEHEAKAAHHEAAKHAKAAHHEAVQHPAEKEAMHPAVEHAHKKWLKPHAKLWHVPETHAVVAAKPTAQEEAATELEDLAKITDAAFPTEHAVAQHHETAEEMHARRKAEVNSAFPAKWGEQEKKVHVIGGPKEHRGHPLGMDHKEVEIQRSLFGKRKFHSERMHAMEMNSVMHTSEERAKASQSAQGELSHFAKISDEVLPKTPAELKHIKEVEERKEALEKRVKEAAKAKAEHAKLVRERHAAHKEAMTKKREERKEHWQELKEARHEKFEAKEEHRAEMKKEHMAAREHKMEAMKEHKEEKMEERKEHKGARKTKLWPAYMKNQMIQKKHMPQSSDTEVPAMGTDQVYIGAHQAGFAHKKHMAGPKHSVKK